ncbi:MAG: lytic transglycosylase domain-containing protein [Magnetospirillum sp. WYHS-4]
MNRLIPMILAAFVLILGGRDGCADVLDSADIERLRGGMRAVDGRDWKRVRRASEEMTNPVASKLLLWFLYTRAEDEASFAEIATFIRDNPGWPRQETLKRRAEESMTVATPGTDILDWFKDRKALTADGKVMLGEALLRAGRATEGRGLLRESWVSGNFGTGQERDFLAKHRDILTYEDHKRRIDRLLWDGLYESARRMLFKMKDADKALYEARLMLRHGKGNGDKAIARLSQEQRADPGLTYERVRYRRKKGKEGDAIELLLDFQGKPGRPDVWWDERNILARKALNQGSITEAYRIVAAHGLKPGGSDYADAEWLAGWIKLRFLSDKEDALQHFQNMYQSVRYPVSQARGAYWAGRAAEALGHEEWASLWYRAAAHHPTTFYGQLASNRLRPGQSLELPPEPKPEERDAEEFLRDEVAVAARILGEAGETERLKPFVRALAEHSDLPAWKVMTATLARRLGRIDLAVDIAKQAGLDGRVYMEAGYPAPDLPLMRKARSNSVEEPLVLAVIRQESLFDPDAVSSAGARGLMQLMPATAKTMAKRLGMGKAVDLHDPGHNLTVGQAYLGDMIRDFGGSYVLALAAYNAGPARARSWMRSNGDPRDKDVEVVDWIEMIPFAETRNYVQRVLENLQVYRTRLSDTQEEAALALERDLRR